MDDDGKRRVLQELHNERMLKDQWTRRALAAEAGVETVHQYLDECYINDPDDGRASTLFERVVRLAADAAKWREMHDDRDRDLTGIGALLALGSEKAWLVHGGDGTDELSIAARGDPIALAHAFRPGLVAYSVITGSQRYYLDLNRRLKADGSLLTTSELLTGVSAAINRPRPPSRSNARCRPSQRIGSSRPHSCITSPADYRCSEKLRVALSTSS